ncbi:MAG: hypothetical protein J6S23_03530 [Clostridia bacterium]|nr:hypothetical protein [Clostridia bacterium]
MKRIFNNHAETAFYDYLLSLNKYKESTVWQYILRIRQIESMDSLINKDLDNRIADFEHGFKKEINTAHHNAYSCALKRLQDYQRAHGIVVI